MKYKEPIDGIKVLELYSKNQVIIPI